MRCNRDLRCSNKERKHHTSHTQPFVTPDLACIYFSGKQKGKQRVPSTLRFRKFPGKTEGVWCSILEHLLKLAVFPESESWSGAKSDAKLRKSARYPGGRRIFSRYTRGFPGIPAKYGILPIWLILGPNQPQTRLRARKI